MNSLFSTAEALFNFSRWRTINIVHPMSSLDQWRIRVVYDNNAEFFLTFLSEEQCRAGFSVIVQQLKGPPVVDRQKLEILQEENLRLAQQVKDLQQIDGRRLMMAGAQLLLDELKRRGGFDGWWDNIQPDDRTDILQTVGQKIGNTRG